MSTITKIGGPNSRRARRDRAETIRSLVRVAKQLNGINQIAAVLTLDALTSIQRKPRLRGSAKSVLFTNIINRLKEAA